MKIRKVSDEYLAKAVALLRRSFPAGGYEAQLVQQFHDHGRAIHEWVCIHTNKIIAYISFSTAYNGTEACGLHLGPLAVNPEFQKQGVGSELLRFALTQEPVKSSTIFVLGNPEFYQKFGFTLCTMPSCPFDKNNAHFLSIKNETTTQFTVGYEPEFMSCLPKKQPVKQRDKGRRSRS
ncbi:MAG: GNAT family N-acetyltransferase [Deltaproteobacteria bacterium RIFOXYD12_FULL_50_9]|nr:MAG: GNAT family N-acetyltransferase [Deltaproteobacteria bacterium RIFOXYD12_FULL_50_9]